jgi:cytoskeletal protein CcmA (bactofilin family)
MDNLNTNDVNRISAGTVFKGEITSPGDILIDGKFDGHLESTGKLTVGSEAQVKGAFICRDIDFGGSMESGTFVVKDTLSLRSGSAIKEGDISYGRLQVELDARLGGTCHYLAEGDFEKKMENVKSANSKA